MLLLFLLSLGLAGFVGLVIGFIWSHHFNG